MDINNTLLIIVKSILDITIVAIVIYYVFKMILKNEKDTLVILGVIVLIIVYGIASIFNLRTTEMLLSNIFSWGIVIIVILFKDEIKLYLEKIGRLEPFKRTNVQEHESLVELKEVVYNLASTKTGALITIEKENTLKEYTERAIEIDAIFSPYLVESIFNKDSPLHDGAIILSGNRITYASTYFPISLDLKISKNYGTRHRAALTISRESDAVTIIISEETGHVSVAHNGKIYSDISEDFFIELLTEKYY